MIMHTRDSERREGERGGDQERQKNTFRTKGQ